MKRVNPEMKTPVPNIETYKMETQLETQSPTVIAYIEGTGNNARTLLLNVDAVSAQLQVPVNVLSAHIQKEIGAQTTYMQSLGMSSISIRGAHQPTHVQTIINQLSHLSHS